MSSRTSGLRLRVGSKASAIMLCLIVGNWIDGAEPSSDTKARCVGYQTRTHWAKTRETSHVHKFADCSAQVAEWTA